MPSVLAPAPAVGIFGKLPARADFVRLGLPRDFVDPWDAWLSAVMSETREQAGEAWLPAFLEAPVWRFSLPAGLCGSGSVLGVMLPSVDRAGRYFPLTVAAVRQATAFLVDTAAEAWLDQCEAAGLAALEKDAGPDEMKAMLDSTHLAAGTGCAEWWTHGSPLVLAGRMTLSDLPSASIYAMMLGIQPPSEQLIQARDLINPLE